MEFLILVHCAALRKETSQSEEKVTTSGYCTKIKVNNCLCTYIHLYTVVQRSELVQDTLHSKRFHEKKTCAKGDSD